MLRSFISKCAFHIFATSLPRQPTRHEVLCDGVEFRIKMGKIQVFTTYFRAYRQTNASAVLCVSSSIILMIDSDSLEYGDAKPGISFAIHDGEVPKI